jgi:hypothetical protein
VTLSALRFLLDYLTTEDEGNTRFRNVGITTMTTWCFTSKSASNKKECRKWIFIFECFDRLIDISLVDKKEVYSLKFKRICMAEVPAVGNLITCVIIQLSPSQGHIFNILKGCTSNSLSLFTDFSATPALPTKPCYLKPIQSIQLLASVSCSHTLLCRIHLYIAVSFVSVLQIYRACL